MQILDETGELVARVMRTLYIRRKRETVNTNDSQQELITEKAISD
ncbi:MAG: hypothetical protein R3204_03405 [Oceanospirillum sp.]|nr:hypothetical protein [Oceanospirillum sp.]